MKQKAMTPVREVMEPAVLRLARDQSLREAAALFAEHDISGAPVCDREGRVLGMLTKTDLAAQAIDGNLDASVEQAMMPEVISVGVDATLERAIQLMAFEGVHRLAVLDERSRLAGIITSMDVLRELAGYGRESATPPISFAPPIDHAPASRSR